MIETAVIVLRLLQYASASIVMGSALFALYALPPERSRGALVYLLAGAAFVLAVSAALGLLAQTIVLAGSVEAGLDTGALRAVIGGMDLGKAAVVRSLAGALALIALLAARPGPGLSLAVGLLGTLAVVSFGWMGHAAAGEGAAASWHLAADVIHALAAATWLGALAAFVCVLADGIDLPTLHASLRRFSRIGVPLVGILVLSGLVNAWFLVGPDEPGGLATTPYGQLLLAKLVLFAAMLVPAALHRNRHTPAIAAEIAGPTRDPAVTARLKRSVAAEAALGLGVLAAVAWLGTLPPPAG